MRLFPKIRRAPIECPACKRITDKLKNHKFEFDIFFCKPCQKYYVVQENGKVAEIILSEQLDEIIQQAKSIVNQ